MSTKGQRKGSDFEGSGVRLVAIKHLKEGSVLMEMRKICPNAAQRSEERGQAHSEARDLRPIAACQGRRTVGRISKRSAC